jgi:hypothetical protein
VFNGLLCLDNKSIHVSGIIVGPVRHIEEVTLLDRQRQQRVKITLEFELNITTDGKQHIY